MSKIESLFENQQKEFENRERRRSLVREIEISISSGVPSHVPEETLDDNCYSYQKVDPDECGLSTLPIDLDEESEYYRIDDEELSDGEEFYLSVNLETGHAFSYVI